MTFLTILGVTEILFNSRLVLEGGKSKKKDVHIKMDNKNVKIGVLEYLAIKILFTTQP